jgi:hypothetical protein
MPADAVLDLRLRLGADLERRAGVGEIDLVILNDLPLRVRGRAIRERVVIYSRDEALRVRFESLTMREFLDFEIHAEPLDRALLGRIAAGDG